MKMKIERVLTLSCLAAAVFLGVLSGLLLWDVIRLRQEQVKKIVPASDVLMLPEDWAAGMDEMLFNLEARVRKLESEQEKTK